MLGQRICELRMSFGWSQVELAKRLKVAKQTVSNWENDNIQPSIEMLVRLSKLFGVTTDYMLGLEEIPRLNVDGLPIEVVAHISMLIEDYKAKLNVGACIARPRSRIVTFSLRFRRIRNCYVASGRPMVAPTTL